MCRREWIYFNSFWCDRVLAMKRRSPSLLVSATKETKETKEATVLSEKLDESTSKAYHVSVRVRLLSKLVHVMSSKENSRGEVHVQSDEFSILGSLLDSTLSLLNPCF